MISTLCWLACCKRPRHRGYGVSNKKFGAIHTNWGCWSARQSGKVLILAVLDLINILLINLMNRIASIIFLVNVIFWIALVTSSFVDCSTSTFTKYSEYILSSHTTCKGFQISPIPFGIEQGCKTYGRRFDPALEAILSKWKIAYPAHFHQTLRDHPTLMSSFHSSHHSEKPKELFSVHTRFLVFRNNGLKGAIHRGANTNAKTLHDSYMKNIIVTQILYFKYLCSHCCITSDPKGPRPPVKPEWWFINNKPYSSVRVYCKLK